MSNIDSWEHPIGALFKSSVTKTSQALESAGIKKLSDLLWIIPLRVQKIPQIDSFDKVQVEQLFRGKGKIISFKSRPAFVKAKRGARLSNVSVIVKDDFSPQTIILQWFNVYPNMVKKLQTIEDVIFYGTVTTFKGQPQIVSPVLDETEDNDNTIIQYPKIAGLSSAQLIKVFKKIPSQLWDQISDPLNNELRKKRNLLPLNSAFKIIHGKCPPEQLTPDLIKSAKKRLIYHEFYLEQLKILARKKKYQAPNSPVLNVTDTNLEKYKSLFPYKLTPDQEKALNQIRNDISSQTPMSRLVQGDVGCGKTTVAVIAGLICLENLYQVSLMCPTEALANQHYQTIRELLPKEYKVDILLGSTKQKEKREIYKKLESGETHFVIGTHSLFQESVQFNNLGLVIIDEQHKFGVEQRQKLNQKGVSPHCLIMTATPIPRSLSLTQYGDLDVSIIKTMPSGRKGIKTKIVIPSMMSKFLDFLNTRIKMGEQAYVVVPAIEESDSHQLLAVNNVYEKFSKIFAHYNVAFLHGKMNAEEKDKILNYFSKNKVQILISTSVVEVGINVPNASIMTIMNPERFGLSSLHQLRGRVGRGGLPGFCFLVLDSSSKASIERLKVFESTLDGFQIAEADLRIRGEGNLFGKEQSGGITHRKIANIINDQDQLYQVREDLDLLMDKGDPQIQIYLEKFSTDSLVTKTI